MIVNSYAVLDLTVSLLRLVVALLVIGLGTHVYRKCGRVIEGDAREQSENRLHLLSQLGLLLVGLQLFSWVLLYLLLQSYVPEWPGVMCIYGVTQIGSGTVGTARVLPSLLGTLQILKPVLVFVAGAWWTLDRINRRTLTAPLTRRTVGLLVAFGLLAGVDATVELGYLVIPKKLEFRDLGCCTGSFTDQQASRTSAVPVVSVRDRPGHLTAYAATNVLAIACLFFDRARLRRAKRPARLPLSALGALLAAPATAAFFVEVASPILLHLPYHHCPYDLVAVAPGAVVAGALFLAGTFTVGWACVSGWFGDTSESRPYLYNQIASLLNAGVFCYGGSVAIIAVMLALA
jgi:hypothetical protein